MGDEGADFVEVFDAGGRFDTGGDVDGGGAGLGDGLGNVFWGESAGEDEAFLGEALAGEFEEVPGEGFADAAIEAGVERIEKDVWAGIVGDGEEAGFVAHLKGFDDVDAAGHEFGDVLWRFVTVELDAVEEAAGDEGVEKFCVGIDDDGDEGWAGGEGGEPGAGGVEGQVAFGVGPEVEADGIGSGGDDGFGLIEAGEAADFDAETIRWRKGGHGAALGQGWEEVLGEGEKAVELWGNGEVTADTGIALEVVDLGDLGGTEEVDDGGGGVGAGVGVGVGLGEEAVENDAGEGLQGEGDEEERVFAPEAHFEGAFGVWGVIDFAVPEGDEGLPDHAAVGEAFFDDEDAGGHCYGCMLTRASRNATETMRGWGPHSDECG